MSAKIEPFPGPRNPPPDPALLRAQAAAQRYTSRAHEAFALLARAPTEMERVTLCEIAEAWLDLAEAALPTRA